MSSSNNGSFLGSFFTFLFMVFLVWMICSPKKEPFFELTIDDYKIELFGKRFVKVESIIKIDSDENSLGLDLPYYFDRNVNAIDPSDLSNGWNYVKIHKRKDSLDVVVGDSLGLFKTIADSVNQNVEDTDITKKLVEPAPETDYGTIEEFEYPDENEFEFN